MGTTYVEMEVANPARPEVRVKETFEVDSGSSYTIVPRWVLEQLGIRPHSKEKLFLANGEAIERELGNALFFLQDRQGPSLVIFGEPGDAHLLGVVTLENLRYMLDPIRRELKPLPLRLG